MTKRRRFVFNLNQVTCSQFLFLPSSPATLFPADSASVRQSSCRLSAIDKSFRSKTGEPEILLHCPIESLWLKGNPCFCFLQFVCQNLEKDNLNSMWR
uniref:Uncharacterized protein n=1 Tax=Kalanchoe fedtschenkoi TaxID=63787 RepID=A0A7N0RB31_KALFE